MMKIVTNSAVTGPPPVQFLHLVLACSIDISAVAGKFGRLVGEAIEAIGQDEQRGGPQADENAEALGVSFFFGRRIFTLEEPPDGDGESDGDDSALEKEIAEKTAYGRVHELELWFREIR